MTERELLKQWLKRYKTALKAEKILSERQAQLECKRMWAKRQYEQARRVDCRETADADEAIQQLGEQLSLRRDEALCLLADIQSVIELLEQYSMKRLILELRYIDCLRWQEITQRVYLSRSRCAELEVQGLDELLKIDRVRRQLQAYCTSTPTRHL